MVAMAVALARAPVPPFVAAPRPVTVAAPAQAGIVCLGITVAAMAAMAALVRRRAAALLW
jgi:hypothetical protein